VFNDLNVLIMIGTPMTLLFGSVMMGEPLLGGSLTCVVCAFGLLRAIAIRFSVDVASLPVGTQVLLTKDY
jgi:hypothetical protein